MNTRLITIIVSISLLLPSLSHPKEMNASQKEMDIGIKAYENGDYEGAISVIKRLLDDLRLSSIEMIMKAHSILGASYILTEREESAKPHYDALLNFDSDYKLSKVYFPPIVINFFESIKNKNNPNIKKDGPITEEAATGNEKNLEPEGVFEISKSNVLKGNSFGNCFVPFGFGQFKNGNTKRGYIFMTSQIVTLLSAVTTGVVFIVKQKGDGSFSSTEQADNLKAGFTSSLSLYLFSTLTGIADACLNFERHNGNSNTSSVRGFSFEIQEHKNKPNYKLLFDLASL